jgi:hypothetical protein
MTEFTKVDANDSTILFQFHNKGVVVATVDGKLLPIQSAVRGPFGKYGSVGITLFELLATGDDEEECCTCGRTLRKLQKS